jgi:hypothetical protein
LSAVASIGVQIVTPKTATDAHNPPQPPANDQDSDVDNSPPQAPPPHGTGKFVDKSA